MVGIPNNGKIFRIETITCLKQQKDEIIDIQKDWNVWTQLLDEIYYLKVFIDIKNKKREKYGIVQFASLGIYNQK